MIQKWKDFQYGTESQRPGSGRVRVVLILVITTVAFLTLAFSDPAESEQPKQSAEAPLIEVMRGLMEDMEAINTGIWYERYDQIEKGASQIANHPKALAQERSAIAQTLGAQMKQFAHYDQVVHHHSDSLAMATLQEDMQEILRHYDIVHQGCVDCHTAFRPVLRDTLQSMRVQN
jgi:cytochrome c556